jgi:hypothetical protein
MSDFFKANTEFNRDKSWARKCQDKLQVILGEGNYEDISDKREVGDIIVDGCRIELKFDRYPTTGNWALEETSNIRSNKPGWAVISSVDVETRLWYMFMNNSNDFVRGYNVKYNDVTYWFNIVKNRYPVHKTNMVNASQVRLVPEKDILANISYVNLNTLLKIKNE